MPLSNTIAGTVCSNSAVQRFAHGSGLLSGILERKDGPGFQDREDVVGLNVGFELVVLRDSDPPFLLFREKCGHSLLVLLANCKVEDGPRSFRRQASALDLDALLGTVAPVVFAKPTSDCMRLLLTLVISLL